MQNADAEIQSVLSENFGRLILNRPDSHNAITLKMWLDIPKHLQRLQDGGARLVVLEGVGPSFAAGADLFELKELDNLEKAQANWDAIAQALESVHNFKLPTIAGIDGPCLGGGCLLAAACDLRYASRRSRFSVPIARLGIALDDASLCRLSAIVGVPRSKELIFRARVLSAVEAYEWGLVNDVFPDDQFEHRLSGVIADILANSPLSIREAKSSFARISSLPYSDKDNERVVVASYLGPEFKERIARVTRKE